MSNYLQLLWLYGVVKSDCFTLQVNDFGYHQEKVHVPEFLLLEVKKVT